MLLWLRARISRNRGVVMAMGLVALMIPAVSGLQPNGPRISWTEPVVDPTNQADSPEPWALDRGGQHVEFSPDGRSLLTYDEDKARIRDLRSGRVATLYRGHSRIAEGYRTRLEESAWMEGGRLLVALVNRSDRPDDLFPSLQVWGVPFGQELLLIPEVGDGMKNPKFAISGDGSTLAYLMGPPGPLTVGVWKSLPTWQPRYFPGCGPITLSADGKTLALHESKSRMSDLVVWDVGTSEPIGKITSSSEERPLGIALSSDGKLLAECQEGKATLWDVETSSQRHFLATETSGSPWFSPDGSLFYAGRPGINSEELVEIWDLAAVPPRKIFHGRIDDRSGDGHRIVQRGLNYAETNGSAGQPPSSDQGKLVDLPSMKSGRILEFESATVGRTRLSRDGRTFAIRIDRRDDSVVS